MSAKATGAQDPLQKRVAVVGSGISGLSAAWLLHRCAYVQVLSNAAAKRACASLALLLVEHVACTCNGGWAAVKQVVVNVPQCDVDI